ncbi:MAG: radical SAM/SPASM domain-containing protein, partial [Proteobacteria bacterium]|nr:radical SAM/SPASM domain-containing protein [Pseudomonadota bacterium]
MKYVQIETTTTCNQRCYFCPVSQSKRPKSQLSISRLKKILIGLRPYDIETIVISGFNEPTYDKQLIEKVQLIRKAGFAVSFCTNGSGLTQNLTDKLLELKVTGFTINLSTIDAKQYAKDRGSRDLKRVIPQLNYLFTQADNQQITVLILGALDKKHADNIQMISEQFADFDRIKFLISPIADYAGKDTQVLSKRPNHKILQGCSMARQSQWLHFMADGNAILCCQDYFGKYQLGHIDNSTVTEIYQGEKINQMRRWVTGKEEAPDDF